jgi:hypothetical protein
MEEKLENIINVTPKTRYTFIPYLKVFAVVLVINSHLDAYYPYPALATGGALGNALFFIVSGFCLSKIRCDFGVWYCYRILRVYPQTLFMALLVFLIYSPAAITIPNIATLIFWPTRYWFIGAIVMFYIPYYCIFSDVRKIKNRFIVAVTILGIMYVACYLLLDTSKWVVEYYDVTVPQSYFRFIFYLLVFISGGYVNYTAHIKTKGSPTTEISVAILSVLLMYLEKYLMDKNILSFAFQFVNQVLVLVFAICVVRGCLSLKQKKHKSFLGDRRDKIVAFVSERSLYYYLAHIPFVGYAFFSDLFFPLNVFVFIVASVAIAETLYRMVGIAQKKYLAFIEPKTKGTKVC